MSDPVELARRLVRAQSVTPAGPEAFDTLEEALGAAGFSVDRPVFAAGGTPVENLFATRGEGRHLALAGHVDVVPPGDLKAWTHGPFEGVVEGDTLWGRGAQDMKGAVAAMVCAACDHAANGGPGQVSLLITGDEEGPSIDGTAALMDWCAPRTRFDAAIVGEPTCRSVLGDTIKVGRRGSLSARVTVRGRQGHVAYQHLADNPVPDLLAIGQALLVPLDEGTEAFAPTNLEVVALEVDNEAWNVIPALASLRFNVRFNDRWTADALKHELARRVTNAAPSRLADVAWQQNHGDAFLTRDEALIEAVSGAVEAVTGVRPEASTGGGTSDARFIKNFCPVVEFGAVGDRMHQVDERTSVEELVRLRDVYRAILERVLAP